MLRRFLFFLFVLIFAAVNGADARLLLHLDGSVTEGKPREVAFKDMAGDFDALPMASNDPNETGVGVVLGMDQTPFGAVGNTAISIGDSETRSAMIYEQASSEPNDANFTRPYDRFSLSLWYKPYSDSDADSYSNYIIGKMGGSGNRGWTLYRSDDDDQISFMYFDTPSGTMHSYGVFPVDGTGVYAKEFKHIAVTFEGGVAVKVYANGRKLRELPALNTLNGLNDVPLQIGNRGDNSKRSAYGIIDDIGLWDEVLSTEKIAAIYALGFFEDIDLQDHRIDDFLNAFDAQGSIDIGCHTWQYVLALPTASLGLSGGSMAANNAFVVLDDQGNGMQLVSVEQSPALDINGDCQLDILDVTDMASQWLSSAVSPDELFYDQLPSDVMIMSEYYIQGVTPRFGDVNNDLQTDILSIASDWSIDVYDNDGTVLWSYDAPAEGTSLRAGYEPPGLIWDFDQDGYGEVLHWRFINDTDYLVIADGRTGDVIHQVQWPSVTVPHAYYGFKPAIANFDGGYPNDIVVLTDSDNMVQSVSAFSSSLQLLWKQEIGGLKNFLGHQAYPIDIDNDGADEVAVSHMVFDDDGSIMWNNHDLFPDNDDHCDSIRFDDIDNDGALEYVGAASDIGVVVCDALTGNIVWQNNAGHAQQIETGSFYKDGSDKDVAVTIRSYGEDPMHDLFAQLYWFDAQGNVVKYWPSEPLDCNPDFAEGDWLGNGVGQLFWHNFMITANGSGEPYFFEGVYHMFDFTNDGAEEVITKKTQRNGLTLVRVYGSVNAQRSTQPLARDADYLRYEVVNHTHY